MSYLKFKKWRHDRGTKNGDIGTLLFSRGGARPRLRGGPTFSMKYSFVTIKEVRYISVKFWRYTCANIFQGRANFANFLRNQAYFCYILSKKGYFYKFCKSIFLKIKFRGGHWPTPILCSLHPCLQLLVLFLLDWQCLILRKFSGSVIHP